MGGCCTCRMNRPWRERAQDEEVKVHWMEIKARDMFI